MLRFIHPAHFDCLIALALEGAGEVGALRLVQASGLLFEILIIGFSDPGAHDPLFHLALLDPRLGLLRRERIRAQFRPYRLQGCRAGQYGDDSETPG
jgi:hypothetical protein